jgi:hypothetical protein
MRRGGGAAAECGDVGWGIRADVLAAVFEPGAECVTMTTAAETIATSPATIAINHAVL